MGIGSANPLLLATAASGGSSDPVTRSLRFDGSAYLSRSTGSTSTTWTLSFWVKRATISGPSQAQYLATWGISGSAGEGLSFRGTSDSSNTDELMLWDGSTSTYSTGVYRDPSAWAHICISVNSGTATVYYNGESVISGVSGIQAWGSMRLGAWLNQNELEGMMADVYGVEDSALDHTSFTESNNFGGLKPKAFTGVGTSGFHLLFEDTSSIGADDAGSNDFTASGLASADIREDNPLKNHATWNPLIKRSSTPNIFTYSEGNTVATYTGGVAHTSTTIASSGVHYAEFAFSGSGTSSISGAGVVRARWNDGHADSYAHTYNGCYYGSDGTVRSPDDSHSVAAVGSNRLGIAFDGANNKADFYSVTSGGTMTLLKSLTSSDSIDFDGSATFTATSHDNAVTTITGYFEEGEWNGTAPDVGSTTATSLNTSNLGTPSVTPSAHFNTVLYNGTYDSFMGSGTSSQSITGVGFSPAICWIKDRDNQAGYSNSYYGHYWFDTVLGTGSAINIDTEQGLSGSLNSGDDGISSFDSDGFSVDTAEETNFLYDDGMGYTAAERYVAWCWKLGTTASSWSGSGQDPDSEQYNSDAGMSIIDYYDGDYAGTSITFNHSLGAAPEFAMALDYEGYHSANYVWHKDLSSGNYLELSGNGSQTSDSTYFPSSPATNTTFEMGVSLVDGIQSHIALFRSVEGFSKAFALDTSSSAFCYLGFCPAWVILKRKDGTGDWLVFDAKREGYNVDNDALKAHSSTSESSTDYLDLLSNGFRVRSSNSSIALGDLVGFAIASAPFKHANAR